MALTCFEPCFSRDGNANDFLALQKTVTAMVLRYFYTSFFGLTLDLRKRARAMLPVKPGQDVLSQMSPNQNINFRVRLETLDQALSKVAKLEQLNEVTKRVQTVFGHEFR